MVNILILNSVEFKVHLHHYRLPPLSFSKMMKPKLLVVLIIASVEPNKTEQTKLTIIPNQQRHHLQIGDNLTKLCYASVERDHCSDQKMRPDTILWTIENNGQRSLKPNEADSRVMINSTCHYDSNFDKTFFRTSLHIFFVGYDHAAKYVCYFNYIPHDPIDEEFQVMVSASNQTCTYSDQCKSRQCYHGSCQCDIGQIYVVSKDICALGKSIIFSHRCYYNNCFIFRTKLPRRLHL